MRSSCWLKPGMRIVCSYDFFSMTGTGSSTAPRKNAVHVRGTSSSHLYTPLRPTSDVEILT